MKRVYLLIVPFALCMAQCSKNNNGNKGSNLDKGLIAWFKFDNELFNYSGSQPDWQGDIKPALDRNDNGDNAMQFNTGILRFSTDSIFAEQLSISFWMKPKDLLENSFVTTSKEYAFGVRQVGNQLHWQIFTGNEETHVTASIKTGWTHVAATTDGKEMKLYLNGKQAASQPHPGKTFATKYVYVGYFSGDFWQGTLDNLRYYTRTLSPEEITQLANE